MKILITLLLFGPSILFAKGINEANYSTPMVPDEYDRNNSTNDQPPAYNYNTTTEVNNNNNSSYKYSGEKIDKTNRQGEAIDVQLRDSAFNLAQKSAKLKEKARYNQKLGWATIGAGGSGAYFFWKARNYRKESSKTKKLQKSFLIKLIKSMTLMMENLTIYWVQVE